MNDSYKILGVSPTDSDEKIKEAYRELVKQYHPDNYPQSPMSEIAAEKMAEVNAAFDDIMNMRRGGGNATEASSYNNYNYQNSNASYDEIRRLIQRGEITTAEGMLDHIAISLRGAEWYFLKRNNFV